MIKSILSYGLLLFPLQLLGQSNICTPGNTTVGQLIDKLVAEGTTSVTIRKSDNTSALSVTRLCEHQYTAIDSLDKMLTFDQVNELIDCENGTLTAVGFIIFTNRKHDKGEIFKKLKGIAMDEYRLISNGCSDAIQTLSLGQYCMNLVTRKNGFLTQNIRLTNNQIEEINKEIRLSEKRYWQSE